MCVNVSEYKNIVRFEALSEILCFLSFFTDHRNPTPPRFNERVNPGPIRTGETIVLSCISQGIPPPTYLWFRESVSGTTIVFNSERIHARDGVLVLQSARVEDAGRYVCHANNTAGSERVELEVTIISSLSIHLAPQQVRIWPSLSLPSFFNMTPSAPTNNSIRVFYSSLSISFIGHKKSCSSLFPFFYLKKRNFISVVLFN